ncbi:MAG: matrixin family metalloprotease [Planctomycetes bacterium]|nr:matrixin family metalloprotease [Planctomycetota bacterium]
MDRAAVLVGLALLTACGGEQPWQARFAVRGRWAGEREIAFRIETDGGALAAEAFRQAVRDALADWQATGCARFHEARVGEEHELVFAWAAEEHGACVPFGTDPSIAHAGPVGPGTFVHFDAEREWDGAGLRRAALHEVGHVLGLDHSPDECALMYPEPAEARSRLADSDLAAIHSLYGGGERSAADLSITRASGEHVLALHSVAPRGLTRWSAADTDGDGDAELLVWRTDRPGHAALWTYHFGPGPALERAVGPRYGAAPRAAPPGPDLLRADLDGDGALEVVRRGE